MTVLKSVSLCRYDLYLISFIQKTFNILKHLLIFHCLHGSTCTMVLMWRSEVNLQELILSFHPVGSKNQTWLMGLGSKRLYQQSHLTTSLILVFFNVWLSYPLDFNINFRIYLSLKKTSVTLIWMTLDVHKSVKFKSTKVISKSCYLDGLLFCTGVCAGDFLRVAVFFVSFSIHWSTLQLVWCACTRLSH